VSDLRDERRRQLVAADKASRRKAVADGCGSMKGHCARVVDGDGHIRDRTTDFDRSPTRVGAVHESPVVVACVVVVGDEADLAAVVDSGFMQIFELAMVIGDDSRVSAVALDDDLLLETA
jgi:hypothetical protein